MITKTLAPFSGVKVFVIMGSAGSAHRDRRSVALVWRTTAGLRTTGTTGTSSPRHGTFLATLSIGSLAIDTPSFHRNGMPRLVGDARLARHGRLAGAARLAGDARLAGPYAMPPAARRE